MKYGTLFFICLFSFAQSFSQQHWNTNIWYFGNKAGVDFNGGAPTAIGNSQMTQVEGTATMCDVNGGLLFYTNGVNVWDRNHQIMPNGTGLNGHESTTQSALILKLPGSDHLYYIFTASPIYQVTDLKPVAFSIVDMTLNNGFGAITTKNYPLHRPSTEKLTATLKANGVDYWIITKEAGTNAFYVYSFTGAGAVSSTPVISHAGNIPPYSDVIGYAQVSPNGSKLALANFGRGIAPAQLFDFDNNSGTVANPINLPSARPAYGVAFSPDNSKLYVLQQFNTVLRQYDLLAGSPTNIQNSVFEVVSLDSPNIAGGIMPGPDGKIYLSPYQKNYISVVNQPNLAGAACNFIQQGVPLAVNSNCIYGLPNNLYYVDHATGCPQQIYSSRNISLCPGQTYQLPSGILIGNPGTYQDTLRNAASCDSIITIINLTVVNTSFVNTLAQICSGQTYQLPSGATFTASGVYQDTMRSPAGCDSLITTLTLTVFPSNPSYLNISANICQFQPYQLPSGHVVYNTGLYQDTIRNVNGCDSIISTVNLLVTSLTNVITPVRICQGQTYTLPSGMVVGNPGIYSIDTVKSVNGCDSIIHRIQLLVIIKSYRNIDATICPGQTYTTSSGLILNIPGIYIDTLRSITGCDSIITTVTLSTIAVFSTSVSIQICSGQQYQLPSGAIVNSAGMYADTVRSITGGCDSIITIINLSVTPAIPLNINAQMCSGQNYTLPWGLTVNTAGVYSDTLRSLVGCDSIITTVTLAIIPGSYVNASVQICSGQGYALPYGTIVNTAGIYYIDTLRSTGGCDSIIHSITLSVLSAAHVNIMAGICSSQTYQLPSGIIVSGPGIYTDTIRSVILCDSIITTINLSVFPVSISNAAVQICSGQTYQLPSGMVVNNAGIYVDTIRSVASCDSIITTINLSVFPVSISNAAVQICSGQTYQLPSGTVVTNVGIYVDTIRSVASCDSIITTINLSVFPVSFVNSGVQICANQTFQLPSGTVISAPGIYSDTLRSTGLCDSIINTITVTTFPVSFINSVETICANQTYQLPSGMVINTAGVYQDTLRSVTACDSLITSIRLLVNNISTTNILDSIAAGQTYLLPSGATVSSAGVYQIVLVNNAGCDSVIITTLKIKQQTAPCITLKNAFTPNADGTNDYWILYKARCFKRMEVNVYNRYGSPVYHSNDYQNDWNGKYKNKGLPDGTYYYVIRVMLYEGREQVFRDNVTILR